MSNKPNNPEFMLHMNGKAVTVDEALNLMDVANAQRNTFTMSDFRKYLPLFVKAEQVGMSESDLSELSAEFFGNTSGFHPIIVIEDISTEDDNIKDTVIYHDHRHKIVLAIPPMFTKTRSLNDIDQNADMVINALANSVASKLQFDQRGKTYADMIGEMASRSADASEIDKNIKLVEKFNKTQSVNNESSTASEEVLDDFNWS